MAKDTNRLQTLDRGIALLMIVAREPAALTVADLAVRLSLARPIVYRIVTTLGDHDLIRRMPDGRLVLGSGALVLGAHGDRHVRARARPVIEALAEQTRATAFLSVAQGEDCVAIVTAEPSGAFLNIRYRVGSRHPLTLGAAGLAILAGRPPAPNEPASVAIARRQGYSVTHGELQTGAVGVCSPVPATNPTGQEFSVGVVALDSLDIDRVADATRAAATELARRFAEPG